MNNLEHIMEGGIDAMLEWRGSNCSCSTCIFEKKSCSLKGREDCRAGNRAWLEAEYAEPDSAEKLSRELAMMEEADCNVGWACLYGHSFKRFDHYDECLTCKFDRNKDCVNQVFADLSKRIAALDA